jgi:putative transposase
MGRPVRLQLGGALYHVTSRGDRKKLIYFENGDRFVWNHILGVACARYNMVVHAYCQMGNHYHLLVETIEPNLADGIRHLNSTYSAYLNRKYELVGHVFQGRYKAIICQRETYLLELARYIVLNPVRASFVRAPEEWWWSSHLSVLGIAEAPAWLDVDSLLSHFDEHSEAAISSYRKFVAAGINGESPLSHVCHQTILGDEGFIEEVAKKSSIPKEGISREQRRIVAHPLGYYFQKYEPEEAAAKAFATTLYSMSEIARYCGVSLKTISKRIRKYEEAHLMPKSGPDPDG